MKQETITKAVEVINRIIEDYQEKLIEQLELRAEAKFRNGNLIVYRSSDYESSITKYEIILADLATIKRAIENNKRTVKIFESAKTKSSVYYEETADALYEAGFYGIGTDSGAIALYPIDDGRLKYC